MKRFSRTTKFLAVLVVLICALLYIFPVYRLVNLVYATDFYSKEQIAKSLYIGSVSDRKEAKEVLNLAEKAFRDVNHSKEENIAKYGLLSRYATDLDTYGHVSHNEHTLKLWSAHLGKSEGCIWVNYTSETFKDDGSTACASIDCHGIWKVKKDDNGKWKVVEIYEHP